QLAPPSWLTLVTSPRAPPSDQRSCWYAPTRLRGLVGSVSAGGSSLEFGKRTLPAACCTSAASAVHALNGLGPGDASTGAAASAPAVTQRDTATAPRRARDLKRTSLVCGSVRPYARRKRRSRKRSRVSNGARARHHRDH